MPFGYIGYICERKFQPLRKVIVIGSGFAGLSNACYLAKHGYDVTVIEKNEQTGGRARKFSKLGYTFDMGPSWYWMPDVFDSFFADFGKKTSDYYSLTRLNPSYRVVFGKDNFIDVPSDLNELKALFERIEPGSATKLDQFLSEAAYKYEVGMKDLVHKPGLSLLEFADWRVVSGLFKLHLVESFHSYIRKYFTNPQLIQLLEFPVLFLGAQPKDIPALYSLMNYADIQLGTWYPKGGMNKIVEAMTQLATELGVSFKLCETVEEIISKQGNATHVKTNKATYACDLIVGSADYHHIEQALLPASARNYSNHYWEQRTLAPSSIIFYLGINKRVAHLLHHTLFFDADFALHAKEIYAHPQWPSNPLFYVSATTKTEPDGAPEGCENIFILIPTAPGLAEDNTILDKYFQIVIDRLESFTGESIKPHIEYRRDYAHNNFVQDYNSFKGNAYGLANTLRQTAILKPSIRNKKIKNLFYTGQLTVPGPGVPPSLISGKLVADYIAKQKR